MNILMFNMSNYTEWKSGIANRNYHILHNLEKNPNVEKIIAIDFLPFTFKRAARNYYECIIKNFEGGEIIFGDLTSKFRQVSSKIYNYTTIDSFFSSKTVVKEINKILKLENISHDNLIIWSYNQMFAELAENIGHKMFIFDMVDNWAYHPSFKNQQKKLLKNFNYISKNADIIFTVSEQLVDFYKEKGRTKNVYWIPNGVDLSFYQGDILNKENELKGKYKDWTTEPIQL